MTRFEALMDACHKRARPIIMTTLAMGAGMLPMAMAWARPTTAFARPWRWR
jgi:multidrug efflux pump subunit AcrB